MNSIRRMIPLALLLTVGPCAVHGQSIVVSGGHRSIVVSGREPVRSQATVSVPISVPEPQKGVDPKPLASPVAVDQSRDAQQTGEVLHSVRLQQWGASWCPSCPGGKAQAQNAADQLGIRLEYFDYDQNKELAMSLGVDSVPRTFVVIDGRIRHRYVGQTPAATIVAKARELVSDAYELPPARAQSVVRQRLPVVQTQWGTIDLETYQRNCNCPMCQGIRSLQQQYRQTSYVRPVSPAQEPTPDDVLRDVIDLLALSPSDKLADIGCGDGRVLIAAVERYGCSAIGVEIDPVKADEARANVQAAGLSNKITIVTDDALRFWPADNGVTAAVAYLYPDLLEQLRPNLEQVRLVVTPFHQVPGMQMDQVGDVWVRRL